MRSVVEFEETKSGTILVRTESGNYVDAAKLSSSGWLGVLGIIDQRGEGDENAVQAENATTKLDDGEEYRLALRRRMNKDRDLNDTKSGVRFTLSELSLRERREYWGAMEYPWVIKTFSNTKASRHGFGVALTRICRMFGHTYIDCSVRRYHKSAFEKLIELYQSKHPLTEHLRKFELHAENTMQTTNTLPLINRL